MLLRTLALTGLALILTGATGPTWEHWQTIPGIFDVAGPRQDGLLVVAGNGVLYLVDPEGNVSPFARGAEGYIGEGGGAESYMTVSPGHEVTGAGCSFAPDDVFVLRLHAPVWNHARRCSGPRLAFCDRDRSRFSQRHRLRHHRQLRLPAARKRPVQRQDRDRGHRP